MNTATLLRSLGLTDYESTVYLALLEKNDSSISDLCRKTKLHRPQVYENLTSLTHKGLAQSITKGKRKRYIAVSPQQLESIFGDLEVTFYKTIDELKDKFLRARTDRPAVSYTEGGDAIKDAHMDIARSLKKNEQYYRYMPVETTLRKKYIPRGYHELRDSKGLERKIITSALTKKGSNKLTRSVRAIPKEFDMFSYNVGLTIYGNKVSMVDYESESVITIEHRKFAEFQKKVFELLFSQLRPPA